MSTLSISSERSSVTQRHLNWVDFTAIALFVAAVCLSLWVGSMLVPGVQAQATEEDRLLNWHAFILQLGAFVLAFAAALAARMRTPLVRWWARASAQKRALALCAPLVGVEVFFAVGFWLTRDRTVAELGYLRAFFWLGREWNPPAAFSAFQLVLLAAVAWWCHTIVSLRRTRRSAFALVAFVCLYLGFDELFMMHERIGDLVRAAVSDRSPQANTIALGPLRVYGWTMVYVPLALILAAVLARMLWCDLPRDNSLLLLVVAGAIFVAGAVGFETLNSHGLASGWHLADSKTEHAHLLFEETMEMFGVTLALFVFARCLFHLRAHPPDRSAASR